MSQIEEGELQGKNTAKTKNYRSKIRLFTKLDPTGQLDNVSSERHITSLTCSQLTNTESERRRHTCKGLVFEGKVSMFIAGI